QSGRFLDRLAAQELVDAFVRVAQAFFEPYDGFPARREAEMTRLDDSRVHRTHRDLMQTRALGLEKPIGRQGCVRARRFGQGMLHGPAPVVEPRPWIGKPGELDTEQIAGRALQAGCRWVERCERGDFAGARVEGRTHYLARGGLVQ